MPQKDVIFSNKHPREMYLLALTEMCQRFAYWGIGNLLVLFLVKYFQYDTPRATHIFGAYTGIAFILPVLGGFIADKWNYKSPIFLGMLLTTIGCILLATLNHFLILPALAFIAFGGGLFTPAIYSLLGSVYSNKQHLREGGFSIYYSTVNIGIFIAMIVLGYLQTIDWRWVFFLSAVVQLLGIIPYRLALKKLKSIEVPSHYFVSKKEDPHHFKLKKYEVERIIVILIMTFISIVFWMAYNQAGSSMTLFALNYTDRHFGGFEIPTPWFISTETFFLILFAFPLAKLYLFLRRIRSPASPPMKTALSLFFMGLCFLVMQRAAQHIPHGAQDALISPYYLIFSFALMSLAELFLAPIGLSLVTNLSPHRYRGLLTGVWFTCIGIGFYLGGYLAGLIAKISLSSFFDIFVFTSFIPAFILVIFAKKLDNMRHIDSLG
ncbi:MAG: peptide MFS transporter [Simkania sp.]|nr:peptide MFS transporter [Simkania sp.]